MADEARAVVELLRTMDLTIFQAERVCDRAKELLKMEPLAKKDVAAQGKCAATEREAGIFAGRLCVFENGTDVCGEVFMSESELISLVKKYGDGHQVDVAVHIKPCAEMGQSSIC